MRRRGTRYAMLMGAAVAVALVAAGCKLVAQGELHVANDESGLSGPAVFRAWEHEDGDFVPPEGFLAIGVIGSQFGRPPSFGLDGFLYLVSTDEPCPMSEGAPEVFEPADVRVRGVITVTDGNVNQMVLVPDTADVRGDDVWALIEIAPFPDAGGGHLVHRCGEVTWS